MSNLLAMVYMFVLCLISLNSDMNTDSCRKINYFIQNIMIKDYEDSYGSDWQEFLVAQDVLSLCSGLNIDSYRILDSSNE